MRDLYGIETEKKKSLLNRCYCFAKDYFGLLPTSGGIVLTGLTYTVLYSLGSANHLLNDSSIILNNPAEIFASSKYGEQLASEWSKLGFPVGQFLTYTAKKRITNFWKEIFGGGDKHG